MLDNKKRIVHLIGNLGLDGTSKMVLDLCKSLSDEYEFHIITLKKSKEKLSGSQLPFSVKVYEFEFEEDLDYSLYGYLKNLFVKAKWTVKYQKLIKQIVSIKPIIVHCHVNPRELMIINSSRELRNYKLLFTDHLTRIRLTDYSFFQRAALSWVYRRICRNFNVIAVSDSVFLYHKKFHIVSKTMLHFKIPNGINTNLFVPLNIQRTSTIRVIYVARLHRIKAHKTLIKAWSLIKSRNSCELLLIGEGNEEYVLRKFAKSLNPTFPITFVGNTSDVLPYLQSSHIGVFPSLNEGLPLSLLEKMACELPVIVSDIPELTSIVTDSVHGLVFSANDSNDLAQKIQKLIDDIEYRTRLGKQARDRVIEKFSSESNQLSYRKAYKMMNG